MEKLINSAFDFFAYALPGAFMILSLLILDKENNTIQDYLNFAQNLKAGGAAVLLAAGYLTSFAVTPIGRALYKAFQGKTQPNEGPLFRKMDKWLGGNLEKDIYDFDDDSKPKDQKMPISKKFVLVRELSPYNFRYIESWHVYSLMSHNMAVANILVFILVLIRLLSGWKECNWNCLWPWFLVMLGATVFTLLFLYSAAKFYIWSTNEQNAAIQALQLQERAQKMDDFKSTNEPVRKS